MHLYVFGPQGSPSVLQCFVVAMATKLHYSTVTEHGHSNKQSLSYHHQTDEISCQVSNITIIATLGSVSDHCALASCMTFNLLLSTVHRSECTEKERKM